jgi:hypothetical protein
MTRNSFFVVTLALTASCGAELPTDAAESQSVATEALTVPTCFQPNPTAPECFVALPYGINPELTAAELSQLTRGSALVRDLRAVRGTVPSANPTSQPINQPSLQTMALELGGTNIGAFTMLTSAQLKAQLQAGSLNVPAPSSSDVSGAASFVTAEAGRGGRVYLAAWRDDYGPRVGGYVLAAVSADNQRVTLVQVLTWST